MTTRRDVVTVNPQTGEIIEPGQQPVRALTQPILTEQSIQIVVHNLRMAERLVHEALEEGPDYGHQSGIRGKMLLDPGANKIINAFQCHVEHKVVYHEETDDLISWAIEAQLVLNGTNQVVATGVGSCATREPKYKYRWFTKQELYELGKTDAEIDGLKKKEDYGTTLYRAENPEYGELANTIMQMAAKRSEQDACKALPSVGSALRKLLDPQKGQKPYEKGQGEKEGGDKAPGDESPSWTTFWNSVKNLLGDDYQKVHEMLGVKSMKDWIAGGKTLDDAIRVIAEKLKASGQGQGEPKKKEPKPPRDPKSIKSLAELYKACFEDFGMQSSQEVLKELGYSKAADVIETPPDCFITIRRIKTERPDAESA